MDMNKSQIGEVIHVYKTDGTMVKGTLINNEDNRYVVNDEEKIYSILNTDVERVSFPKI